MRHDSLKDRDGFDTIDVAAVWPASAQVAPLPIQELDPSAGAHPAPAAAAPDVPPAAGLMIAGSYLALLAALAVVTVGSGKSVLAIVIAAFFMLMFFSIPAIFLGVDGAGRRPRSFDRFMQEGMQTLTGHSGGAAALVQMLVVPVLLTFGVICIGIASLFIR